MKLRNKKTGEINLGDLHLDNFNSLAELNEEWEDYEEPKWKHWYMTSWGEVWQYGDDPLHEEWRRILGNDFETKEEAEKAVEKLKAWKRLKDKGFRFCGWTINDWFRISICTNTDSDGIYDVEKKEMKKDLDLLFGGEE